MRLSTHVNRASRCGAPARGPYNRKDIRDRLVAYDGPASDLVNGLQPAGDVYGLQRTEMKAA